MINALSNEEIKRLAVIRAKCERDPLFFMRYFFKTSTNNKFILNWHHETVNEKLMSVAKGDVSRLLINVPPRHSKTMQVAEFFIPWSIAINPASRWIYVSFSNNVAKKTSVAAKKLIESKEFQMLWPHITISKENASKTEWYVNNSQGAGGGGGYFISSEMGVTGYGAGKKVNKEELEQGEEDQCEIKNSHIDDFMKKVEGFAGGIIIDDPNKVQKVSSGTPEQIKRYLEAINENFVSAIKTRLNSKETPIIVIMQRLHQDDFAGFLLKGGDGDSWEHLKLSAIQERTEPDGKIIQFPLWENEMSLEDIEAKKKSDKLFSGQYLQDPQPDETRQMIKLKYFGRYDVAPKRENLESVILSLDTASSEKEINDPSIISVFGLYNSKWYLLDVMRERLSYKPLKERLTHYINTWKPNEALIENKASGIQLIQELKAANYSSVVSINPTEGKLQRMYNEIAALENGLVLLPTTSDWLFDFEQEVAHFPNVTHDDQVDSMSQFLKRVREKEADSFFIVG